jgi:hypothetical protein
MHVQKNTKFKKLFLISNFRRVINVIFFFLWEGGDSPASEFYMPAFWNTLALPASYVV